MNYKLYWELTNEGDARLLRAFGETPEPRFPAEIEGRAIMEIGDYCFAAQAHLPAECRCSYVQEAVSYTHLRRWVMYIRSPTSTARIRFLQSVTVQSASATRCALHLSLIHI